MKKSLLFLAVLAFCIQASAQVGINADNSVPDPSAMLDVKSTTRGFLPPKMTTLQRNAIVNPVEGLVIYNTDQKVLNLYGGNSWYSLASFQCGVSITINHVFTGGVAPLNKTTTYGTSNNIPGEPTKCWITSNLGSDHQATAVSDATEASAGWYWQFNRKQGYKHDGITRTPNTTWISSISENSDWQLANDPCNLELGAAWRLPTYSEWYNVDNTGGWTNWIGPWSSGLKLHASGYLYYSSGSLGNRGSNGYYWSSSQFSTDYGWYLYYNSVSCSMFNGNKASGCNARCLRDN